ncbi:uncharacterized protein LOC111271284 isoform X2 [Varroa jacobsoni]|uniref:uncharacterized protein LOC111271284 isoform X2 n=1 Tax=Varroa jacobsoni TaxID=62625 RepID=UPI000BF5148C|nr:uncharacterized protein LOC111271284 isoform X2 [Varroa jacobsoni]
MKRSQISVLSRGGTGKCVLCGRREGTNALSKVKLFQFPPMGEPRRALWLNRCGLQPEALPSRAKICNVHFVSGSSESSSTNSICVGKIKTNMTKANNRIQKDSWNSDSDNAEDDSLLFEDECPREDCQRQAQHMVELLVRVGILERTVCDLRHNLQDKEKEIASLLIQMRKPLIEKTERQQRTIVKLRAELNSLRRQTKPKKRPTRSQRTSTREDGYLKDKSVKTSLVADTASPIIERTSISDQKPKGRSEQEISGNGKATETPSYLSRSALKLQIRTNVSRYFEDNDASGSSCPAIVGMTDKDLVPPEDGNDNSLSGNDLDGNSVQVTQYKDEEVTGTFQMSSDLQNIKSGSKSVTTIVAKDADVISELLRSIVCRVAYRSPSPYYVL